MSRPIPVLPVIVLIEAHQLVLGLDLGLRLRRLRRRRHTSWLRPAGRAA